MEMSKDFLKVRPNVKITINQQAADYTIRLNHIEHARTCFPNLINSSFDIPRKRSRSFSN